MLTSYRHCIFVAKLLSLNMIELEILFLARLVVCSCIRHGTISLAVDSSSHLCWLRTGNTRNPT